jgi:serine/threonine-protein kinase
MELVEGRSLRALVGDGSTPPAERARILVEIARALGAAHDAGLVHRDVKPENVLVRADGRVKVLDFGIARRARGATDPSAPTDASLATLTADGIKVGTPMYMAPEQIRGEPVDGRADQFAWAVTAYELFTGRPPWTGADALALIASIMTEQPAPLASSSGAPSALAEAVRRALEKKPADRFNSMSELLTNVDASGIDAAAARPNVEPGARAGAPPSNLVTPDTRYSAGGSVPPASWAPTSFGTAIGGHPISTPRIETPVPSVIPMPLSLSRRYSPKELIDMFDRALAGQPRQLGFEEVAACARGMGLDEGSIQRTMTELARRGAVEPSAVEKARSMMKVKRQAAIWGVFVAFFFLLNLFDRGSNWWFQYPSICWGLWVGVAYVRAMFPTGKRAADRGRADAALELDSHRLGQMMMAIPAPVRVRVDPAFESARTEANARVVITPSTPPPARAPGVGAMTPGQRAAEAEAAEIEAAALESAAQDAKR